MRTPSTLRSPAPITGVLSLSLALACGKPAAWGEANSLILVAPDDVWAEIEAPTYAALEPTIFTTRDEKKFQVTQIDPGSQDLRDLRVFHQVIVLGPPDDPLILEIADAADLEEAEVTAPSIFSVEDVWARGQVVTAVVVEPGREADSWTEQLPRLLEGIEQRYRAYVLERMFVSGVDTVTQTTLNERFGFSLEVPNVYELVIREEPDTVVILRNDNPDPSELIRSLLIAWQSPLPALSEEAALEWRAAIDSVHYNVPQGIEPSEREPRSFTVDGKAAIELTGVWVDEGDFPAAGPYILWMVQCPDRTVLIDAWLYAPRRPKYEYMIQLQQILDSFTCGLPGSIATAR